MKFKRRQCDGLEYVSKSYLECIEVIPGITKSLIYVYPEKEMDIGFYMIAEYDEDNKVWLSHQDNYFNGITPKQ